MRQTLWSAIPRSITGEASVKQDIPVYISLSIRRNAIVLSPTIAYSYHQAGKDIRLENREQCKMLKRWKAITILADSIIGCIHNLEEEPTYYCMKEVIMKIFSSLSGVILEIEQCGRRRSM